jgi:hypothetical protein
MKNLLEKIPVATTDPESLEKKSDRINESSVLRNIRLFTAGLVLATQINCGAGQKRSTESGEMEMNIDNIQLEAQASEFWEMNLPEPERMREFVKKKINVGGPNYFHKFPEEHRRACNFRARNWYLADKTVDLDGLDDLQIMLPEEFLKEHLNEYLQFFPKNSTSGAGLDSIVYMNFTETSPYPGLEGRISRAVFSRKPRIIKINLHQALKSESEFMEIIMRSLPHEIGHSIDFISNTKLSPGQTVEMLYIIFNLMADPGRPKIEYVEGITSEDKEKQNLALYGRSVEYFAEIARIAMNTSGDNWESWTENMEKELINIYKASEESAKQNTKFIKNLLLFMDGQFEPWEAYQKRIEIGQKITVRIAEEKGERELASNPK